MTLLRSAFSVWQFITHVSCLNIHSHLHWCTTVCLVLKNPTFGLFMLLNCYEGIKNASHDAQCTRRWKLPNVLVASFRSSLVWQCENNVLHLLVLQSVSTEGQWLIPLLFWEGWCRTFSFSTWALSLPAIKTAVLRQSLREAQGA